MARNKEHSLETQHSVVVLRKESYSMREIAKNIIISYKGVHYTLHRIAQTGSVGGAGAQLSRKRNTSRCLVRETTND